MYNQGETIMEQSISYGLHKIGFPTIIVEYEGQNLLMMLDTGSNDNYLAPIVYKVFGEKLKQLKTDGVVLGANGTTNGIITVEMPIKINGKDFLQEFKVLPFSESFDLIEKQSNVQVHGIIGTRFMYEQGWVIDFVNEKVYEQQEIKQEDKT